MTSTYTQEEMEQRLVRYNELRPCTTAFIDTRTPGNQKENFTIIGPGVAESLDQYVHIDIPHGFNIGGVRQEPHSVNSQHSHETAEVFIVQNGRWAFRWGVEASEGEVILEPGDVISIPSQVFRGFENIGNETAYMCSVLGGDDPGRVTWAPAVFEMAREYGLVLLEDGQLIDTANGESIPEGILPMPPTSEDIINSMHKLTPDDMHACIFKSSEMEKNISDSLIGKIDGVKEIPVIGSANFAENIVEGKMTWPHGFHMRCVEMEGGSVIKYHQRLEEEVIYLYEGSLDIEWENGKLTLGKGDVITIPINLNRRYSNPTSSTMRAYFVHGSDQPSAPQFIREAL